MVLAIRLSVFASCLLPFAWLVYAAVTNSLGPDPGEAIMESTGEWALRLLALTLLVSPLRKWSGWSVLIRLRRMLGLYAFFYGCIHLLVFLQFFSGWDSIRLLEEIVERPYITVGFSAWLLMLPLAITSTHAMQRRLGRNWLRLHRLVYPCAVLACLHLLWQARSDIGEALIYAVIFGFLLGWRLLRYWRARQGSAAAGV